MELTIDERLRHLYVGGKTGVGKSHFLESLAFLDIRDNRGFAFIDPHGPSALRIADAVPRDQSKRLIFFEPRYAPIAFNPLAGSNPPALRAAAILEAFKGIWWPGDTVYPLTEWVLLYSLIALAERSRSSLLELLPLLTDEEFQEKIVARIKDGETKRFWTQHWPAIDKKDRASAIRSIANKMGAFLAFPEIRWVLGSTPRCDITTTMDKAQILIADLSKGSISKLAAKLLGSLLLSTFYTASFSRKNTNEFFLYVDECRNFSAPYGDILAEARKFNLGLTLTSQALHQLPSDVQADIIDICGSLALFRLGSNDASILAPELNDEGRLFNPTKLTNLPRHTIWLKRESFGAVTNHKLPYSPPPSSGNFKRNLLSSRSRYGA